MKYRKESGSYRDKTFKLETWVACDRCGTPHEIACSDNGGNAEISFWTSNVVHEAHVCAPCFFEHVIPALRAIGIVVHDGKVIDLTPPIPPPTPPTEEQRSVMNIIGMLVLNPRHPGT